MEKDNQLSLARVKTATVSFSHASIDWKPCRRKT